MQGQWLVLKLVCFSTTWSTWIVERKPGGLDFKLLKTLSCNLKTACFWLRQERYSSYLLWSSTRGAGMGIEFRASHHMRVRLLLYRDRELAEVKLTWKASNEELEDATKPDFQQLDCATRQFTCA
ncbi:unnamed protein product [Linum trigynum]|uniref:Uncharacterized protein n=1 Tax=Linum trigynum TaxID=586398 RepID=A0AAV2D1W6_9ROSI